MKIELIAIDRLRSPWARSAVEEYLGRVGRYVPARRREVRAAHGDDERARAEEGERLLKRIDRGPGTRVVALSPEGQPLDSEAWARFLEGAAGSGVRRLVFVIGGAGGLSSAVLEASDLTFSLGPQTLQHELAQVVLAEQLYRAWTIIRGEAYHK